MSKTIIGIYGASGFGREVLPLIRKKNPPSENIKIFFIDDGDNKEKINGCSILSYEDFLDLEADQKFVTLAIANSSIREKLALKVSKDNLKILDVISETTIILDEVEIGRGAILANYTHITSNVVIGQQFQANIYSYVAHDCVIGDFVTFAPNVHCNGNVHIEDHAYIGTGAIIKQGSPNRPLVIGRGAVVGMGAVVTKSVPAGATVIGNPAKPLSRDALRK